eukprot:NODE_1598_length_901_cov_94.876761_g1247_i0.p1 GENE.NODE_1598_length_901_cov_94.876761_g1247_i0~~NODE_1598_length_901_cov_94.876761_g1247_i0.p1  ORF type:complete len:202 (-),score=24.20 NODE_1598_length_901_cov_94.876761_g1247_i0:244-849(-)
MIPDTPNVGLPTSHHDMSREYAKDIFDKTAFNPRNPDDHPAIKAAINMLMQEGNADGAVQMTRAFEILSVPPGECAALQVIRINDAGDSFEMADTELQRILAKVPEDMPISVVCVVGAFRTGKSFLLDLFLRFLRHTGEHPSKGAGTESWKTWLFSAGEFLEGCKSDVSGPMDDTANVQAFASGLDIDSPCTPHRLLIDSS